MSDFAEEMAGVALELIGDEGRTVTFKQVSTAASPSDKPWRGTGAAATSPTITAPAVALTSFRALGEAFLKDVEQVFLVASQQNLSGYDLMIDDDGAAWKVVNMREIRPGTTRIATFVGVAR